VDSKSFETTGSVGDTNVDFPIETTETTKSGIDRVGSVRSSHNDDVGTSLHSVHEGEELRNDTTFDFSVGLPGVERI
jgi:hypothetical protein